MVWVAVVVEDAVTSRPICALYSCPLISAIRVMPYVPVGVSVVVTMVRVEWNSGFATPRFCVKIATLRGGTALAANRTSALPSARMLMSNFAKAPALIVLKDGSICNLTKPVEVVV